jgi:hypothetical protein
MTTILNGLLGGLVVGLVAATATRLVAGDASGGRVGFAVPSSRWSTFAVRLSYGCLAGGALVALELFVLGLLAVPPTLLEAFGVAVAWSALLFGVLSAVRWVASSRSLARSHLGGSLVYHLVYGLGLGLWIRLTWIT